MPSPKGNHDVYILKVGNEYRVRPAVWSVGGQGSADFAIRNLTDFSVVVRMPSKITASGSDELISLGPKNVGTGSNKSYSQVQLKGLAKGIAPIDASYSVVVFTDSGPVSASGESEPVIIIDPPPA